MEHRVDPAGASPVTRAALDTWMPKSSALGRREGLTAGMATHRSPEPPPLLSDPRPGRESRCRRTTWSAPCLGRSGRPCGHGLHSYPWM